MSKLYEDLGRVLMDDPAVYTIYMQSQHAAVSDYDILLQMVKTLSAQKKSVEKSYADYMATDVRPLVLPKSNGIVS